jgi:uncharacterized protein YndB with AHSA1/START domain
VATTRRQRRLSAPPEEVWKVLEDPHHMPRWWPGVTRMEAIEGEQFTQVFMTKKGRPVRADQILIEANPPGPEPDQPGYIRWGQDIQGTPFERVLSESITEVHLQSDGGGTLVTIIQTQKLRGYSKTGGFMIRRATRRKLNEALDALAQIV